MKINKNLYFWILLILVILLSVTKANAASVISDKPINNKYRVDCLGNDNEIFIYNAQDKLNYRRDCDGTRLVEVNIIENGEYLEIRNKEENEEYLYYKEIFNKIDEDNYDFLQTEFNNNICFEIKTKSYKDIRILDKEIKQTKNFYECFEKNTINEDTIKIYIDNKLKKEIDFTKSKDISINIKTFDLINVDFKNFVNIEFTNPNKDNLKIQVLDTNLGCDKKSFYLSDKYILSCNVTARNIDDITNYYIQVKTEKGDIFYKNYQKPILPKKKEDFNLWLIVFIVGIIIVVIWYNLTVSKREETAIDTLENED